MSRNELMEHFRSIQKDHKPVEGEEATFRISREEVMNRLNQAAGLPPAGFGVDDESTKGISRNDLEFLRDRSGQHPSVPKSPFPTKPMMAVSPSSKAIDERVFAEIEDLEDTGVLLEEIEESKLELLLEQLGIADQVEIVASDEPATQRLSAIGGGPAIPGPAGRGSLPAPLPQNPAVGRGDLPAMPGFGGMPQGAQVGVRPAIEAKAAPVTESAEYAMPASRAMRTTPMPTIDNQQGDRDPSYEAPNTDMNWLGNMANQHQTGPRVLQGETVAVMPATPVGVPVPLLTSFVLAIATGAASMLLPGAMLLGALALAGVFGLAMSFLRGRREALMFAMGQVAICALVSAALFAMGSLAAAAASSLCAAVTLVAFLLSRTTSTNGQ